MNLFKQEVYCRSCKVVTKLLWIHSQLKSRPPLCEKCFKTAKNSDSKVASEYKVHFLPIIHSPEPYVWEVSEERQYKVRELGIFIQDCVDATGADLSDKPYLTKDKDALRDLVDCLTNLCPATKPIFVLPPIASARLQSIPISKKQRKQIEKENAYKRQAAKEAYEESLAAFQFRSLTLSKLRNAVESMPDGKATVPSSKYGLPTHKVYWKILPRGKHPFAEIVRHFEQLRRYKHTYRYDIERLRKIHSLEPVDVYVGIDEFDGYIVFDYSKYGFAILDCPIIGNAVYVLSGNWRYLSTISKSELLHFHRPNTKRVIHSGDWFLKLRRIFNTLRSRANHKLV